MNRWKLEKRIEKIIESNCTEYEWEGTEVDRGGMKMDILELIDEIKKELIKDFVSEQLSIGGNTEAFIQKFIDKNEERS